MGNIQKSSLQTSKLIIKSVTDHTTSILKYNPLAGSSYKKLRKELDTHKKD